MQANIKTEDILTPFIRLAHILRSGDSHSIEGVLNICNLLIAKYANVFQDKKQLTALLASINSAYQRRDYVCLADIYEYEMTAYLKAEIEGFTKTNGTESVH